MVRPPRAAAEHRGRRWEFGVSGDALAEPQAGTEQHQATVEAHVAIVVLDIFGLWDQRG